MSNESLDLTLIMLGVGTSLFIAGRFNSNDSSNSASISWVNGSIGELEKMGDGLELMGCEFQQAGGMDGCVEVNGGGNIELKSINGAVTETWPADKGCWLPIAGACEALEAVITALGLKR